MRTETLTPPDLIIRNVRVVTPDVVLPSTAVVVSQGIICDIATSPITIHGTTDIDGENNLLLPGFIDIHSDVIENAIQPRPGGQFPIDIALHELDKQLVACGVATIFHCLCFLDNDEKPAFRNAEMTDFLVHHLHRQRGDFRTRTHVHARYEISNSEGFVHVERLINERLIHFFSLMDHTPGQGQFSDLHHFRAYYAKARGLSAEHVDRLIEQRLEASGHIDWEGIAHLTSICQKNNIQVASHDDDTSDKVAAVSRLGATTSEFPVNLEAAQAARRHGMFISLGSPNVLRGASLTDNLSGQEAIKAELGDILCSDYAPMSLLHAALKLHHEDILSLPQAIRMISLNAAHAAGIDNLTGSIEIGKSADMVMVDDRTGVADVLRTFVEGREVYTAGR